MDRNISREVHPTLKAAVRIIICLEKRLIERLLENSVPRAYWIPLLWGGGCAWIIEASITCTNSYMLTVSGIYCVLYFPRHSTCKFFFFIVKIQRDYSSMTSINIYQITNSFLVTVYEVDIASKRRGKHVRNTDTYTFLFVSCCKQNLKSYDNVKKNL